MILLPTERTPPHLFPFVTCLAAVIFLVLGITGLLVAWPLDREDNVRRALLIYGGFFFAVGILKLLVFWLVRRIFKR
jgi:hypothetical protein